MQVTSARSRKRELSRDPRMVATAKRTPSSQRRNFNPLLDKASLCPLSGTRGAPGLRELLPLPQIASAGNSEKSVRPKTPDRL